MADQKIATGDIDLATGLPYHSTWTPGDKLVDPDGNPAGGSIKFEELVDVPAYAGKAGYLYAVKATVDGVEHFPATFAGQSGRVVAVKGTEDGFELILAGSGGKELAPRHVVGISNAPYSDAAADCDYLHENNAVLGNSPVTDGIGLAIAAAVTDGFGEIYIRAGYYETEIPWVISGGKSIKIIGEGRGSTRIKFIGTGGAYPADVVHLSSSNGVTIQDLTLEGPDDFHDIIAFFTISGFSLDTTLNRVDIVAGRGLIGENPGIYNNLFYCNQASDLTMLNVRINPLYVNLAYPTAVFDTIYYARVERCKFTNANDSNTVLSVNNANNSTFRKNHVQATSLTAAYAFRYDSSVGSENVAMIKNVFSAQVYFTAIGTTKNIKFEKNSIFARTSHALNVTSTYDKSSFSKNQITGDAAGLVGYRGISIVSATGCKVNKNVVEIPSTWFGFGGNGIYTNLCEWTQFNENQIEVYGENNLCIYIDGSTQHCEFNENQLRNRAVQTSYGFYITSDSTIKYNSFNDNILHFVGNLCFGFYISGALPQDNGFVANNILIDDNLGGAATGFDAGSSSGIFSSNQIKALNGATQTANTGAMTVGTNRLV